MSNCENCCCQVTEVELVDGPQPLVQIVGMVNIETVSSDDEDGPFPVEDEPP